MISGIAINTEYSTDDRHHTHDKTHDKSIAPITARRYKAKESELNWCKLAPHYRKPVAVDENDCFYCAGCLNIARQQGLISLVKDDKPTSTSTSTSRIDCRMESRSDFDHLKSGGLPSTLKNNSQSNPQANRSVKTKSNPQTSYSDLTHDSQAVVKFLNLLHTKRFVEIDEISKELNCNLKWAKEVSRYLEKEGLILRTYKGASKVELWHSLPYHKDEFQKFLALRRIPSDILSFLDTGPKSSLEIAKWLGCCRKNVTQMMRSIRTQIVSSRDYTADRVNWYALPRDILQLKAITKSVFDTKLLHLLEDKALSVNQICQKLPEYTIAAIRKRLLKLTRSPASPVYRFSDKGVYYYCAKPK